MQKLNIDEVVTVNGILKQWKENISSRETNRRKEKENSSQMRMRNGGRWDKGQTTGREGNKK